MASRSFVVAINVAAIIGILIAAEFIARWMGDAGHFDQDDQLAMCRPDSLTIWRYRPDVALTYHAPEFDMQVRTNPDGLRGPPVPPADDAATVLVIGDSFTFGWGVGDDQRYSDVIARRIEQAAPGMRLRMVNAGHWMFTFDQQLVLMKQLVERYRPKVVLQGIYWMHIRSLFNHQLQRSADGELKAVSDDKIRVTNQGVLKFRSDWLERPPLNSQLVALGVREILNRDLQAKAALWVDYMRPGQTPDEDLWILTEQLLGETARTLQASGIAYVPFLVPTSVELPGGNWRNVGWTGSTPPDGVDVTLPAARLAAIFSRARMTAINLAPRMQRRDSALYYPQDGHWTAAGHAAAAEILTPAVTQALAVGRR